MKERGRLGRMTLRAVLFDSGGVLVQPIGGRWNPRADFEQIVLEHIPSVTSGQFRLGIDAGQRFLDEADGTPGYEDCHRVILRKLHAGLGLDRFFEAYAISAELGCNKPDPRMYRQASDALGLTPAECLFVDDDPQLVAAAIELGYQGRAVRRDGIPAEGIASIAGIDELLALF